MSDVPPVTAVADVLALWGLDGWLTPPLQVRVAPGSPALGAARTVRLAPEGSGGLGPVYELLSARSDGEVLVIDAAGVQGAVWGEILGSAAASTGLTGVLVGGSSRDGAALRDLGLPTYSADLAVVGPNGRAHVTAVGADVDLGGATVSEEDVIVVDGEGCARIPADLASEVLDAARQYADAEASVLEAMRSGTPLREAYVLKKETVDRLRDTRR